MEAGLYLVERYLPGATHDDAASAAERVAVATEQMAAEGVSVRYLGGTFIPTDETCFCEFEAPSREVVEWANERANAPFARILPAVRLSTRQKRRRSA
jgi:Nickel responsive protein SCO4226-like